MKKLRYLLLSAGFILSTSTQAQANTLKNIIVHNDPAQITLEFSQPINFEKKFIQEKIQLKIYLHDTKILKTFHQKILAELAKLSFIKQVDIKQKAKNHLCSVLCVTLVKDETSSIVTGFHIECIKKENARTLVINISKQQPPHLIESAITSLASNSSYQDTAKKKILEL
ncbi:MAG: hypothetical protein ABH827_05355 [bacterium]